jgi:hypothetical protein
MQTHAKKQTTTKWSGTNQFGQKKCTLQTSPGARFFVSEFLKYYMEVPMTLNNKGIKPKAITGFFHLK